MLTWVVWDVIFNSLLAVILLCLLQILKELFENVIRK